MVLAVGLASQTVGTRWDGRAPAAGNGSKVHCGKTREGCESQAVDVDWR